MESSIWNTFLVSCTTFGVVFFVFVLLYFVMLAMALVSKFDKEPEPEVVAPPAIAPTAPAAIAGAPVSPEIVAAITAALVADLGEDNFIITSITPVAKVSGTNQANSAWAQAGRGRQMQNLQSR